MSESIKQAESAIKAGDTKHAFELLRQVLAEDPNSERAWWIMSGLVQRSERANCLEQVLRINPENQFARDALTRLKQLHPDKSSNPYGRFLSLPKRRRSPLYRMSSKPGTTPKDQDFI